MKKIVLCIYILTGLGPWVLAQSAAETNLQKIQGEVSAQNAELALPINAWREKYLVELNKLKARVQAAGDLDQLLVLNQELEQPGSTQVAPPYTALKRLQGVYIQRSGQIEKSVAEKQRKLLLGHRQKLKALQTQLTQAGSIDDALLVKAAVGEVEDEIRSLSSSPVAGASSPRHRAVRPKGNKRPGRLIAFGSYANGDPVVIPDELQNKLFVKAVAGYDHWMVLGPNGQVFAKPSDHKKVPEDVKPAVDISCGRHMNVILHADGTITGVGGSDHTKTIPEGLKNVRQVATGHSMNVALLADGTMVPFGYMLRDARYPNTRNILRGGVKVACGTHDFFILRRDGTIESSGLTGKPSERKTSDWTNIVDIYAGASTHGILGLDRDGKVHESGVGEIPKEISEAEGIRQIRTGSLGGAVQLADGTWMVWGAEPLATNMNQALKKYGPLKDLNIGSRYFIGIK